MANPKIQLAGMFHELGALIDISRSVTIFNAAKILTIDEFDAIMDFCESQFAITDNADPDIYYKTMKDFKELFHIFKQNF